MPPFPALLATAAASPGLPPPASWGPSAALPQVLQVQTRPPGCSWHFRPWGSPFPTAIPGPSSYSLSLYGPCLSSFSCPGPPRCSPAKGGVSSEKAPLAALDESPRPLLVPGRPPLSIPRARLPLGCCSCYSSCCLPRCCCCCQAAPWPTRRRRHSTAGPAPLLSGRPPAAPHAPLFGTPATLCAVASTTAQPLLHPDSSSSWLVHLNQHWMLDN